MTLIETSKEEVVEKAKALARRMTSTRYAFNDDEEEFLAAVTLLEAREAMKQTEHLDEEKNLDYSSNKLS